MKKCVKQTLLFLICIFVFGFRGCDCIDCIDEDGFAVDW